MKKIFNTELFRYGVVGIGAVAIDLFVYFILTHYMQINPSWSKRISFIAGGIWSFFINKFFTFRKTDMKMREPFLFALVYLTGFIINSVVHDKILQLSGTALTAFICATAVSVVWNYVGQKWLVFRKPKNINQA